MTPASSPIARFIISFAAFIIVVAGLKASADLAVPFLMAVFISVLCMPPILFFKGKGLPHWLAVLLVISALVILGILLGTIFGRSLGGFADDMPVYQERLMAMAESFFTWLGGFGIEVDSSQWQTLVNPEKVFPLVGNVLSSLGNMMTNALLILLTVVFIVGEEVGLYDKLRYALPKATDGVESLRAITKTINEYMAIKAAISLLTGFLAWLLLTIVGVDYAILWGTLAFLLNFVPTLGSLLAAVPAVLLALVQIGPLAALYTTIGYVVINLVVGNVIEPKVMGKGLGLTPIIVLVSLVFWGWILGPVGMLLSVPLTMMVKIALEVFPDTRWVGTIMGPGDAIKLALKEDKNPDEDPA